MQLTISSFFKLEEIKVLLFPPAFSPFTCHMYIGLSPSFTPLAVKVTVFPWQIVVLLAEIVTVAGFELTCISISFEIAGLGVIQCELLETKQFTTSLSDRP